MSVGLDVGAISVKAAVATAGGIERFTCRRIQGRPAETVLKILENIEEKYGKESIEAVVTTGSGGKAICHPCEGRDPVNNLDSRLRGNDNGCGNGNWNHINEFQAISLAVRFLHPEVRTIFEIGGQTSKYILLDDTGIIDYGINGDCAAGTGSFIDQQATRLRYKIEEIGDIVSAAEKSARIAGRCSVFAKSDMIHAQQMGYEPGEVLKGLCLAVARNFKATIVKGRKVKKPAAFIGGVALNAGVIGSLKELFDLDDNGLIIPKDPGYIGAVGCALYARSVRPSTGSARTEGSVRAELVEAQTINKPLSTENVVFLRDRENAGSFRFANDDNGALNVYLGLDVGSVSTNLVLLSEGGELIYDIYTRTRARPIEVVSECLKDVESKFGGRVNVCGAGTTGSGRELIGELVGADVIKDEITAHKTGAIHIAKTMTDGSVDTIFEIGGQDSKFIRIENGVVVDFTMNEACAAGTGSFLEEQAEKLGIKIKDEFAGLALSSKAPINLGERCTVFMERDVSARQMKGGEVADIVAGLSYSVVLNYLNRVVRGRNIGNNIFFQGGTAYNDAVAAAFAMVLGKKITVPPHNGVIGAVGAALLAKDAVTQKREGRDTRYGMRDTTFKGFDIDKIDYSIREFTCKACTNECDVQEFTVDGSKTYWGDKCSSRYRKKAKSSNKPVLADLVKERNKLLLGSKTQDLRPRTPDNRDARCESRATIGIPRAMYFFDRFPFWNRYLTEAGFRVVISDETNKKITAAGISSRVAEPCHPIGIAHGHIIDLLEKGVDYIWLPNILTAEPNGQEHVRPYLCPWGMTLPYVACSSPVLEKEKTRFISPTLHHMHGPEFLGRQLFEAFRPLGIKKSLHRAAFKKALLEHEKFRRAIQTLGEMALHKLDEMGKEAVVLVGRPYNLLDLHINLNIPAKIRSNYGVDVIPMDLLPVPETDIRDVADQMFWNYGKKILSAAKFIKNRDNLHMIYVTNFKCGPDSFIKHFVKDACGKPFLTLQFDEHSNDAGVMTRVEAYLDSKGLLKSQIPSSKSQIDPKSLPAGQAGQIQGANRC